MSSQTDKQLASQKPAKDATPAKPQSQSKVNEQKADTSDVSAKSKTEKPSKRSKEVDTALHLVKGAIVRVLGPNASLTTAVAFESASKGAITVKYEGEKPTDQQLLEIERVANEKIQQNVPVREFDMERKAAETTYKNGVNHTAIYDAFPVPDSITTLRLVEIADFNINCCQGPHLETTGALEHVCVAKVNADGKGKFKFSFIVGKVAADAIRERDAKSTPLPRKGHPPTEHKEITHTQSVLHAATAELLQQTLDTLAALKVNLGSKDDPKSAYTRLQAQLGPSFESTLSTFQNRSYTNGMNSRIVR